MKRYRSSIPKAARERVVATLLTGPQRYKTEYRLNGKVVGVRYFHPTGELESEYPLKNDRTHGVMYRADIPGKILSAAPYFDGLMHGTAKQWSHDGKLIGTYTMVHGTGIDLWRSDPDGSGVPRLSEARYLKDGKWHGFEWWLAHDQKRVWQECHFQSNLNHGIERSWNTEGRLRRGYPRYWVKNVQISKRQYLRACAKDPTLPRFREKDNRPQRKSPAEVAAHLA